eukprot:TRINITY_DN8024_c0_g1_i1.p1 TRINITY_DN8024_c0_g1~~TRINITY_DN8024_c0_g1_i1.p1  ORF type:complete len:508 (+),score=166.88 TRINITY_DN8024_c0_g1_i1:12-1535(+)
MHRSLFWNVPSSQFSHHRVNRVIDSSSRRSRNEMAVNRQTNLKVAVHSRNLVRHHNESSQCHSDENDSHVEEINKLASAINKSSTIWKKSLQVGGLHKLDVEDRRELLEQCHFAADRNHAPSQFLMGLICGSSNPPQHKEALDWFIKAASPQSISPLTDHSKIVGSLGILPVAHDDEDVVAEAAYAAGMTLLLGDATSAFQQKEIKKYYDEDDDAFLLKDGYVLPKDDASDFDPKKWVRNERRKNLRKKAIFGKVEGDLEIPAVQVEIQEAVKYLQQSANHGYGQASFVLSELYLNESKDLNLYNSVEGIRWLEISAKIHRNPMAWFQLGEFYRQGQHLPKDLEKALACFQEGIQLENPQSKYTMAYMLCDGSEIPKDVEKGIKLMDDAAKNGFGLACAFLAINYQDGAYTPPDHDLMWKYLNMGDQVEDVTCLSMMGDIYLSGGFGIPKNLTKALSCYQKAARRGSADAFVNEGVMFFNGWGVDMDLKKAFYAYQNAISLDEVFSS